MNDIVRVAAAIGFMMRYVYQPSTAVSFVFSTAVGVVRCNALRTATNIRRFFALEVFAKNTHDLISKKIPQNKLIGFAVRL
jgi:hypothetical protein